MPSYRLKTTKAGKKLYEISVSRGYGKSPYTKRWYVPDGWSQKSIDRKLKKVAAAFEQDCKAGKVLTKKEQQALVEQERRAAEQIPTLKKYAETIFMPSIAIRCSENTRASYQSQLSNHIYPVLGEIKLPNIRSADISAFLLDLQTNGMATGSVIKVYTILHSLFASAYKNEYLEKNPMDKVDRPKANKSTVTAGSVEYFTCEELQYILQCLQQEPLVWQAYIALLIDSGMRKGEASGLKWEDVDFSATTVTVKRNLQYTSTKGVYLDTPKSGKQRTIDVSHEVIALLQELHKQNPASDYIFCVKNSSTPMHPQSPTKYMKRFGQKYKVTHFHPHKLRHSFASIAILNGADIASVSQKLGHSDAAITLKVYTHTNEEGIKRASDIFREALKQTPQNYQTESNNPGHKENLCPGSFLSKGEK